MIPLSSRFTASLLTAAFASVTTGLLPDQVAAQIVAAPVAVPGRAAPLIAGRMSWPGSVPLLPGSLSSSLAPASPLLYKTLPGPASPHLTPASAVKAASAITALPPAAPARLPDAEEGTPGIREQLNGIESEIAPRLEALTQDAGSETAMTSGGDIFSALTRRADKRSSGAVVEEPVVQQVVRGSQWLSEGRGVNTALSYYAGRFQVRRGEPFFWKTPEPRAGYTIGFKVEGGEARVLEARPDGIGGLDWKLAVTQGRRPVIVMQVFKNGELRASVPKRFDAPTRLQWALRLAWQAPLALLLPLATAAAGVAVFAGVTVLGTAAGVALFGPHAIAPLIGWVAGGAAGVGTFYGMASAIDRWGDMLLRGKP